MKLLIATYADFLVWNDGDVDVIRRGHRGSGEFVYYGVSWNRHSIFLCEGSSEHENKVHVYDRALSYQGKLPFSKSLDAPHQCFWWDGTLYVANTYRNRIETWGRRGVRKIRWLKQVKDTEHINSIWCDGKYFYVVGHRWREQPKRIWLFSFRWEAVRTFKITEISEPPGLHNVYVEDGILYTLGTRDIIKVDQISGEEIGRRRLEYYLRGFARTEEHFIVGASKNRKRKGRAEGNSKFYILDNDLEVVDTVTLRNTGGITEIRAIEPLDRAHNGVLCPYR